MSHPPRPHRATTTLAFAALILLGAAACEGDDILPPGTPTGSGTVASAVGPWLGHEVKVAPGATTTIAFRVTDSNDLPVSGVTLTMVASNGTLASSTGTSDANGIVRSQFTTSTLAVPDTITANFTGALTPAEVVVDVTGN